MQRCVPSIINLVSSLNRQFDQEQKRGLNGKNEICSEVAVTKTPGKSRSPLCNMTLCCLVFLLCHRAGADRPPHALSFLSVAPLYQTTSSPFISLLDPNVAVEVASVALGDCSIVAQDNLSDSQRNCLGLDLRHRSWVRYRRPTPASFISYLSYLDGDFWRGYLWIFFASVGVAVVEALLILRLLRGRAQYIRSEMALQSNAVSLAAALGESEERFRLMADSAPVLMWVTGTDKLRTDFNKEWLRFTGRALQQESEDGWMLGVHPADLPAFSQKFDQAFEKRERFAAEYRLRRN